MLTLSVFMLSSFWVTKIQSLQVTYVFMGGSRGSRTQLLGVQARAADLPIQDGAPERAPYMCFT